MGSQVTYRHPTSSYDEKDFSQRIGWKDDGDRIAAGKKLVV